MGDMFLQIIMWPEEWKVNVKDMMMEKAFMRMMVGNLDNHKTEDVNEDEADDSDNSGNDDDGDDDDDDDCDDNDDDDDYDDGDDDDGVDVGDDCDEGCYAINDEGAVDNECAHLC